MNKLEHLKAEIQRLDEDEVAELVRWISDIDWQSWDRQIEADSRAGSLDFLSEEARHEKERGELREL